MRVVFDDDAGYVFTRKRRNVEAGKDLWLVSTLLFLMALVYIMLGVV